jgi:predicted dehydrogenase
VFGTFSAFRMPWAESFMIFGDKGAAHAVPNIGAYGGGAFIATDKTSPKFKSFMDMFAGFQPVRSDNTGLPTDDSFANQLMHFADCCRTGREPISSGSDNIGTMKVVLGIYQSGRTGKPVEL